MIFITAGHPKEIQWHLLIPLNESLYQYLSNELSCTLNEDRMQKLRPREVDVLTYLNGAHMTFGTPSPRDKFLDFYGFGIHFNCKKAFKAPFYSSSFE